MTDRKISLNALVAGGLWLLSAAALVVAWVVGLPLLGVSAVGVSVAAMTATVRYYFTQQASEVHNAFELGRESVRLVR